MAIPEGVRAGCRILKLIEFGDFGGVEFAFGGSEGYNSGII